MNITTDLIWITLLAVAEGVAMILIMRYLPWLFALIGIVVMGWLDYLAIRQFVETFPPRTFQNGVELFCLIPFLTLCVLVYAMLFYMDVTGQLREKNE